MNNGSQLKIVVLISGRGSNLEAIIKACGNKVNAEIVGVISNRPDAAGLKIAKNNEINHIVIDHTAFTNREEFENRLELEVKKFNTDLIILAGFMRVLTAKFVNSFRGKMINIHPSLLPELQGLNTHRRALELKKNEHGASVHFVTEDLDGGPVIMQASVPVLDTDDEAALGSRVLEKEHIILPKTIECFAKNRIYLDNENKIYFDGDILKDPIHLEE